MKESRNISLAGILTALCVVCLAIGTFVQTLDLTAAALGSIIILIAFIELGKKWSWGVFAVSAILSVLILPHKLPCVVFALFSGFYPILKEDLNRIQKKWLSYTVRIATFNIAFVLIGSISVFLLKTDITSQYGEFIYIAVIGFILLANITFILFDLALERIAVYYISKIRPKVFGK